MRFSRSFYLYILTLLFVFSIFSFPQKKLKIASINVWSGSDYRGFWNFGMYETPERRESRFQNLTANLKADLPDVIFVQEANPVDKYVKRLAYILDYDYVYQVCNGGIKILKLGPPFNYSEGIAVLSKRSYNLEYYDAWKLSGSFGIYGDLLNFNFDESNFALCTKITVDDKPIFLISTHFSAEPPFENRLVETVKLNKLLSEDESKEWMENSKSRTSQADALIGHIKELPAGMPVILGGDFNSEPNSAPIKALLDSKLLFDASDIGEKTADFSWSPVNNENIKYSTQKVDAEGNQLKGMELVSAIYDTTPRKIDYIFLSSCFKPKDINYSKLILTEPVQGIHASDHFGIMSEIDLSGALAGSKPNSYLKSESGDSEFEGLPIISYDTDVGLGYGCKLFLLNKLGLNESFDLVLFNSTKGERWYRFVFSLPDFELRQGKEYPLAIDLVLDYDKYINNNYFGTGNQSRYGDQEYYTKEPFQIALIASRGLTGNIVGQIGVKYKLIKNYNFSETGHLKDIFGYNNEVEKHYTSVYGSLRFDTRNSFINPTSGLVLQGEFESSNASFLSNVGFSSLSACFQYYSMLFYPTTVFAARFGFQALIGNNLPFQVLLPIGGSNTLRGSTQDRFLDNISSILNTELRFPIFWRFGGVIGFDAGKVWHSLDELDLNNWSVSPVVGLRFFMDTFVVRIDVGFGSETTGFFLNFGHLF